MKKRSGSLGFTLRREDNSVLGHYVRALVREPALSDGRLRPGDRILAVNGVSMCQLSHEEAVAFLRRWVIEIINIQKIQKFTWNLFDILTKFT